MDMALGNKQSLLTYTTPSGGSAIGNNTVVQGVKAGSHLTISDASNTLTFDVDTSNLGNINTNIIGPSGASQVTAQSSLNVEGQIQVLNRLNNPTAGEGQI